MNDDVLRDEINKRLTLNWLIQGAAQHAGMTVHHLVADELNSLDPRFLLLYDQFALIGLLQWWHVDGPLVAGSWPSRFWRRAASKRCHPFFAHPLLSTFGGMLAATAKERALERSRDKAVTNLPILYHCQALFIVVRLKMLERHYRVQLTEIAKKATSKLWGIPVERLEGEFSTEVGIERRLVPAPTIRAAILRALAVGYGGPVRRGGSLTVYGRGTNWRGLTHELVKGTAELICLHGLQDLDDQTYQSLIKAADRIDFEPWMLQTGGELWRRLLAVLPEGRSVAHVLMQMAQLRPKGLESLIRAVIDQPELARELLARLDDVPRAVKQRTRTAGDERISVQPSVPMSFPLSERARSRTRLFQRSAGALLSMFFLAAGISVESRLMQDFFMDTMDAYGKMVIALVAILCVLAGACWTAVIFQGGARWKKWFDSMSGAVSVSEASVQVGSQTIERSSIASVRKERGELIVRYRRAEKLWRLAIPVKWLPAGAADQICEALDP